VLGLLGLASFTYGLMSAFASEARRLDPLDSARARVQKDGYIYASNGKTVLAVLRGDESRVLVSSRHISPRMKIAIVAVEDRRFYEHRGIDIRGMARAAWADLTNKKVVQGGSTITQQFVKNAYVGGSRSFVRKFNEAVLAHQLEQNWSKDKILTAYLNTIYFGNGAYGIQRAAKTYFGHGAAQMTWAEAALLAGIPADPTRFDPVANPGQARQRREVVLSKLLEQGYIDAKKFREADAMPLPRPEQVRLPIASPGQAQYFTNYVKQQLVDEYGAEKVFGSGMRVVTSIDLDLQRIAREAISKWLPDENGPSAALVAIDPQSGEVLSMIGGRSFRKSQFNLAVQGERQPGSSFKPFVLATALRQGISPFTTFESKPVTIPYDDKLWEVHNYENSYLGSADLETATIESDNSVYAQLTHVVGPDQVAKTAHELGITSQLDNFLAIGLGGEAVNPLEMARAYATFANNGVRIDGSRLKNRPRAVLEINGRENTSVEHEALTPNQDAILTNILERVTTEGTGQHARLSDGRPIAGKTGTTENYGDAWFVGYVPQLAVAVWVGYPDTLKPMLTEYYGEQVAGGTFPAKIWKTFVERAIAFKRRNDPRYAPQSFPQPQYVESEPRRLALREGRWRYDNTGLCRVTREVLFFVDAPPSPNANCKPNEVEVPNVIGEPLAQAEDRLAAQPLKSVLISKPAAAGQRLGIVVGQLPDHGFLSSWDEVKLVVAKPLHGVVPRVVGLTVDQAKTLLANKELKTHVRTVRVRGAKAPAPGRVLSQTPSGGVAAAPGMGITVVVGVPEPAALSAAAPGG
jgi:penicillin-binding protein 1A